ncbi:sensor histidine kinase [Bacillus massilinigeriensis]|uniref:sensor histidine kinase n=1 Tax=Bacillus massilionigeriensis TaxID=1805475 RepID=UPI00096B3D1E|nr:sensor histidine kinase [Bacillus massilionigeriensis]
MGKTKGVERVERLSSSVEIVIFCFRLLFYVFAVIDLYIEKNTFDHFYFSLFLVLAAMIIPLVFWVPLLVKKSTLYCITEFVISGSLSIYAMAVSNEYSSMFVLSALTIAYHLEKRYYKWFPILLIFPLLQFIIKGFIPGENGYMYVFINWVFTIIGFGFNMLIESYKRTQELNRIIEEQNQNLLQYAKQIETLTLVEERNRMARDLHDTLGHSFISYILGLDAVQYLVDSDSEKAKGKIEELREHAAASLDEIRETIHEIGSESDILLTSNFQAIINEFTEYTNTRVTFKIAGEEYFLHHSMRMALLRTLQESLTNAKRHGKAEEIQVGLSFHEDATELAIRDNGMGSDKITIGFGLKSMKDRVEALNGELKVESALNFGTSIKVTIPYRR